MQFTGEDTMLREEDDPEVLQEAGADVAEKKGEGEDFLRQVQTETALLKDCLDNGIEPKDTEKGPSGEDLDVGGLPDEKELRRLLSVENPSEAFRTETAKSPRGSPPHSNDHLPVTLREALEMRGDMFNALFRLLVRLRSAKGGCDTLWLKNARSSRKSSRNLNWYQSLGLDGQISLEDV